MHTYCDTVLDWVDGLIELNLNKLHNELSCEKILTEKSHWILELDIKLPNKGAVRLASYESNWYGERYHQPKI